MIMTDYVQLGRDAARAKKRQEEEVLAQKVAREDEAIRRFEEVEGRALSRELANVFGADPDDPDFANLAWRFVSRPRVEFDDQGVAHMTPAHRLTQLVMETVFQGGVEIVAHPRINNFAFGANFSVRRGDSSGGFSDLATFGEQLAWLYPEGNSTSTGHRVARS